MLWNSRNLSVTRVWEHGRIYLEFESTLQGQFGTMWGAINSIAVELTLY